MFNRAEPQGGKVKKEKLHKENETCDYSFAWLDSDED